MSRSTVRALGGRVLFDVLFVAAYYASTHVGLLLMVGFGGVTPLWPASGVALVLLLRRGAGAWPLIVVGELLTALSLGQPIRMGLAGGVAQSAEALLAVALLRRAGITEWFRDVPQTVYLSLLVCLAPPLASASLGTAAQVGFGVVSADAWTSVWFTWWLGDAMGLLIVAPLLHTWWPWPFRTPERARQWGAVAGLMATTAFVLMSLPAARRDYLFFSLLPFVAWLSMRFRAPGATSATAILATLVFGLAGDASEPFRTAVYVGFVGASAYTGYLLVGALESQRRLVETLRHRADHDSLTGLHNRSYLEQAVERCSRDAAISERHALILLDLDHFKLVNDTCGHDVGDRLLRELASLLSERVPAPLEVTRMGGDEFAVLVPEGCGASAESVADGMRRVVLDYSLESEGQRFALGASIGIAYFHSGESASTVLSRADIACYAAKDLGRDGVHVFHPEDRAMQRHYDELGWVADFRRAMAEGELVLFGQAILPVDPAVSAPPFYEVLLRKIEHDEAISPGRFLPAAERYGLMPAIDRWVMSECFRRIADPASGEVRLSINLAPTTVDQPSFLETVEQLAAEHGVDPARVCFEVTETIAIRHMTRAVDTMRRLTELGFRFALDDFGSGVASFGYLAQLPVHFVKVDGQFVHSLHSDDASRIVVSSLAEIAALRGLRCIAEGVEGAAALEALGRIGVELAQGFHLHRPAPLDEILAGARASAAGGV